MKTKHQVQFAHDVLHAVAAREIDLGLTAEGLAKLHAVHDALSWILDGPCGEPFEEILREIQREAKRRGYVLLSKQ